MNASIAPHVIDLRSDTVTKPTAGMRRAMAAAEVGDDVFGEDPTVNRLQAVAAELLGKEAALFVPSGTMANQLAIRCQTELGDEVLIERGSHPFNYEVAGAAAISGVQLIPLDGRRGLLDAAQIAAAARPPAAYLAPITLLCLENTHNRGGGSVYTLERLTAVSEAARRRGLRVHLDGARLFNACVATGTPAADFARCAESVSFCLSKGLGAPVGSVLAGPRQLIARAVRFRRMLGGGWRQAGMLAAAGLYALEHHVERLAEDHANARRLAEGLATIEGVLLDPATVETNIVVFDIAGAGLEVNTAVARLAEAGVRLVPFGPTLLRAVTHLDLRRGDIERALHLMRQVFRAS
ncbi:MAG: aminotransferase class I/II-fold pyridoxal phosphate-dependent enzyme [Candidatus Tectomicrobia bacterium]|nr:aminotransferase class I/II-fold pyridoxal phosphate-dependent enzyme [Candidatus Tectomicrobia bacterium]